MVSFVDEFLKLMDAEMRTDWERVIDLASFRVGLDRGDYFSFIDIPHIAKMPEIKVKAAFENDVIRHGKSPNLFVLTSESVSNWLKENFSFKNSVAKAINIAVAKYCDFIRIQLTGE